MLISPAAGAGAAPEIQVDFVGLSRLAAHLDALAHQLADSGSGLIDQLADPELVRALRHAEQDWHSHRRQLQAFLADSATAVRAATNSYLQVETGLAGAAGHRP